MKKSKDDNTAPLLNHIKMALNQRQNEILSPVATMDIHGIRRIPEQQVEFGYRQNFAVDTDRILHARAYARYIDKTQVFYLINQLVSKIARTIGRFLGLNEDLIEAIALGHDIGHTPFGHDGERILSELCYKHGIGYFQHNVQSVQFLDQVERKGRGWNLCLQTLDGILCHDGEIHNQQLKPLREKTFETLGKEITVKKTDPETKLVPMTLEGCVVRMADTISYIGRDLEDAIRLNIIKRSDIPKGSVKCLGNTNGTIVFNLVSDIIATSFQNTFVAFSMEVSEALKQLKAFNLERIYLNPDIKQHLKTIRLLFKMLFERYLEDIERKQHTSVIFTRFLKDISQDYVQKHNNVEIVRDFIAGMTDQYFLRQCPEEVRPKPLIN
jgi:dGTPase